jgi:hypothetical protein
MENSERYAPLSAAEVAALKKKSGTYTLGLVLMAIVAGIVGLAVRNAALGAIIMTIIGVLLFVWFIARGQIQSILVLNKDIRDGRKKIIVDRVESQRQDIHATGGSRGNSVVQQLVLPPGTSGPAMSYAYLIKVRGREFNVSERQYYQCKPGQLVEVHLAPHSGQTLYVDILKDSMTEHATA